MASKLYVDTLADRKPAVSEYSPKHPDFWRIGNVRVVGKLSLRSGVDDWTKLAGFYFRKGNPAREGDVKPPLPSIVQLDYAKYPEFVAWIMARMGEIKKGRFEGLLAQYPHLLEQELGTPNFFENPLTLELGKFRIRPSTQYGSLAFILNNARKYQDTNWEGPCIRVSYGAMRYMLAELQDLDETWNL